ARSPAPSSRAARSMTTSPSERPRSPNSLSCAATTGCISNSSASSSTSSAATGPSPGAPDCSTRWRRRCAATTTPMRTTPWTTLGDAARRKKDPPSACRSRSPDQRRRAVRVEELVLCNIGVYRGEHRINLTTTDDRPVVLIGGLNGGGKTTILDSLQLALYGKRARCSNRGTLAYEEFLRRTVSRGAPAEEGAYIEVAFSTRRDGHDHRYRVTRSFAASGRSIREDLVVRRDGQFDPVLSANWDDHIEDLLPLEVATLFFFDGEKIEALADPEQAGTVIGAAIRSLFGLELVDRLHADLLTLERRKRAERFDETAQADLARLEAILAAHEEHREAAILERAAARTALDRARIRLDKAKAAYRAEGGELFDARADLAQRRSDAAERVQRAETTMRDHAAGVLPLALVRPLLQRV